MKKYSNKLVQQGLCDEGSPLFCCIDAEMYWNRQSSYIPLLEKIISPLNINSLLYAVPAEPYVSIIRHHAHQAIQQGEPLKPEDTESRTFLHDIPASPDYDHTAIIAYLKKRKGLILPDGGIITWGAVSPEQAFIFFSSICFSTYVKFFADYYFDHKLNKATPEQKSLIKKALSIYEQFSSSSHARPTSAGPFLSSEEIITAMAEAGRLTIETRMVDSFFGNISYKKDSDIYISQTGSSMDELEGYIDICPVDGSSSCAITASSEFPSHKSIYALRDMQAILHGHPKFSVIMSLLCDDTECVNRGSCHIKCTKKRHVEDVPIIPGEVGAGPRGLVNTLPPSLTGRGSIVYGHGVFTVGQVDFTDAFKNLADIESMCFDQFVNLV